jgi:hypothetical protein
MKEGKGRWFYHREEKKRKKRQNDHFFFLFEIVSHYIAQEGLELWVLLPQTSEY